MTYQLDVLVPSRGRPRNILRLMSAIRDTAECPDSIRVRVRLDDDDPMAGRYRPGSELGGPYLITTTGSRTRLASSWNELAEDAWMGGATHIALWGDDNIPVTKGWDRAFVDASRANGPGFYYGRDGVWDHTYDKDVPGHLVLPTATVWPIETYRALGWVAPAGLVHLCIDLAWRDLGVATGTLHYLPDVQIRHLHRCVGAPDDQTYRDANDNSVQYAVDQNAFSAWRNGSRFTDDMQKVNKALDAWRASRA